jgi:polyhydroxyalkanoate synthesis repressor PhaR
MPRPETPIVIKKYDNRRLYNAGAGVYASLEDLAAMVRQDEDFIISDARTDEDITWSVLMLITPPTTEH